MSAAVNQVNRMNDQVNTMNDQVNTMSSASDLTSCYTNSAQGKASWNVVADLKLIW